MRKTLALAFPFICIVALFAADKPRVYVTDSTSWEISGAMGGTDSGFAGSTKGGARPQTGEIIKTFGERCPSVVINNKKEKADYVILLDHEGGKDVFRKDNKVVVFNWDGDSILSHSTRSLGNSVKDACEAIQGDWAAHANMRAAAGPGHSDPAEKKDPAPPQR